MLQRTEGECIDCKTIILGFIYLIFMLRFLRITNKERGLPDRANPNLGCIFAVLKIGVNVMQKAIRPENTWKIDVFKWDAAEKWRSCQNNST